MLVYVVTKSQTILGGCTPAKKMGPRLHRDSWGTYLEVIFEGKVCIASWREMKLLECWSQDRLLLHRLRQMYVTIFYLGPSVMTANLAVVFMSETLVLF
jgi:hypothetical protein